jgi:hypothetical protein
VAVAVGVGVNVAVAVGVGVNVAVGVAVGVGDAHGPTVVTVRVQPPTIWPRPVIVSSTRYRLHVPLGLVPLKIDSAEPPKGAGAGAGHVSGLGA